MKVFVGGDATPDLMEEFERIKNEINTLATDGFTMETINDSTQSNYYIFLGRGKAFSKQFPTHVNQVNSNLGTCFRMSGKGYTIGGKVWRRVYMFILPEGEFILPEGESW